MTVPARVARQRIAAIALLVLAACSTAPTRDRDRDPHAPSHPPDLSQLPDPVPHIEPPSRYGNSSPYEVLGKTYYVLPNPGRYREYGTASWYGAKFHGRLTSSGEPYDMYQLTAAHRSLPIPCYLRVTNLENQRSAIVRVNDRGPFHSERLIDLSYAAAVKLGFADRGVTRVMLELVDGTDDIPQTALADQDPMPAEPPAVAVDDTSTPIAESGPGRIFLQAGAFSNSAGAERLRRDLRGVVGDDVHVQKPPSGDRWYRVRIGPLTEMSEALRLQALIVAAAFTKPLIVEE